MMIYIELDLTFYINCEENIQRFLYLEKVSPGFEPGLTDSKSVVLTATL